MSAPEHENRSHRRYNPLLDEWVLCSSGRLRRPWRGERGSAAESAIPAHDPSCYMCPGNPRAGGERNPDYEGAYVFDNDYPALGSAREDDGDGPGEHEETESPHELFRRRSAGGRCRVLCYSERHDRHLGELSLAAVTGVVEAWIRESRSLGEMPEIVHVQIFENRGAAMGASNAHPHGQIWGVSEVPTLPARKAHRFAVFRRERGRDLLGVYLEQETLRRRRIVAESEHWVWLVPFWAVWPFETMLLPRRRAGRLDELTAPELEDLARALRTLNRTYDRLFQCPFPYSMGWYEAPLAANEHDEHDGHRLHAVYLPPLLRSATIRKFLVGYELTAEPQRDLSPEEAAERLRSCREASPSGKGGG